jgi:hypothetical protein
MLVSEQIKEPIYDDYRSCVDRKGKLYDKENNERKYLSLVFLHLYTEIEDSKNNNKVKDHLENNFTQYTTRAFKSCLKEVKAYIFKKYNKEIYKTRKGDWNNYEFNNYVINDLLCTLEERKVEQSTKKIYHPSSPIPVITIANSKLTEDEHTSLRLVLEKECSKEKQVIYNIINKTTNKFKTGLCIHTAPTGSGKSYHTTKFLTCDLLYKLLFDKSYQERNTFFITDTKSNLFPVYQDTYNHIVEFCNENMISQKIMDYLHSKLCFISSNADVLNILYHNNFENDAFRTLQDLYQKYLNDNDKKIDIHKRKIYSALNKQSNDNEENNDIADVANSIKTELKNIYSSATEDDQFVIENIFFNAEAFFQHNSSSPCIFFATTDKALLGVSTLKNSCRIFDEKGNIFFIDESDKQYQKILSNTINATKVYDLYLLVRRISSFVSRMKFKHDAAHENQKIENMRKEFVIKGNNILNNFDFDNSLHIDMITTESISIFNDHINTYKMTDSYYISFYQNDKDNINHLNTTKMDKKDFKPTENDPNFITFFNAASHYLDSFAIFITNISREYNSYVKHKKELSNSDIIKILLNEISLDDRDIFEFVMSLSSSSKERKSDKDKKDLYLNMDIDITKIIASYENGELMRRRYTSNPNYLIKKTARDNLIHFLSATGENKSCTYNFNLSYLKNMLGDNFYTYTEQDKKDLHDEFEPVRNIINNEITINVKKPEVHDRLNFDNAINPVLLKLKSLTESDYQFKINRHFEYANCILDFAKNKNSKILLMLLPAFPDLEIIECINKYLLKPEFNDEVVIFPNKTDINGSFERIDANFIRERANVDKLYEHLTLSNKNKVVIMTPYQTAGAGVNLQPKINENINLDNYINVSERESSYFDIDSLFIGRPTNLIGAEIEDENDHDKTTGETIKCITHLKTLLDTDNISIQKYNDLTNSLVRNFTIASKPLLTTHMETEDYQYTTQSLYKQDIGRISRTNIKNKNITIYVSQDVIDKSDFNIQYNSIDTPEFVAFAEFINAQQHLCDATNDVSSKKEKVLSILNKDNNHNHNSSVYFSRFKRKLLKSLNFDHDRDNKIKSIEQWDALRQSVLKSGVFLDEENINEFNNIGVNERMILNFNQDINQYYYNIKDKKTDNAPVEYSTIHKDKFHLLDSNFLKLDVIASNKELKKEFISRGYCLDFKSSRHALPYWMINDIYKGALGEVIGQYYFAKYFDFKINNDKDFIVDFIEVCDFYLEHAKGLRIGIDMKNYNLDAFNLKHQQSLLRNVYTKINDVLMDKIIIANTFLDKKSPSVKFGTPTIDGEFIPVDNIDDATVCIVNGILKQNGSFIDHTPNFLSIMEFIK